MSEQAAGEPTPQPWWDCCPQRDELVVAVLDVEARWIECHYDRPVGSLLLVRFEQCSLIPPTAIPALEPWGAALLAGVLAIAAVLRLRRRPTGLVPPRSP